ncbi:MAG: sigma factor-like helix-turn-helix DNA-binding protein, partial [Candidatus Bathyarchaeia archaeon]
RRKLEEFKETLPPREREILERRMLSEKPVTLRELGEKYGVTPERVRQIESEIVKAFQNYLKSTMPDFEYYL